MTLDKLMEECGKAAFSGDSKKLAKIFLAEWNGGLRDRMKEQVVRQGGDIEIFEYEDADGADPDEIYNLFMDIDENLYNEGLFEERAAFYSDLLELFSWKSDPYTKHTIISYVGDSLNQLGRYEECDRLLIEQIEEKPKDTQCLNMYLNCLIDRAKEESGYQKAREFFEEHFSIYTPVNMDNELIFIRAMEIYAGCNDVEKVEFFKEKLHEYRERNRRDDLGRLQPVIKPAKVYPNDPCPCGSGKKYKKCCGKR